MATEPKNPDGWRTGRSTGRTIWYGEYTLHGMVDTAVIATRICEAMNEIEPLRAEVVRLRAALRAVVDEISDDSHEDSEDAEEMLDSIMKIHCLAVAALAGNAS